MKLCAHCKQPNPTRKSTCSYACAVEVLKTKKLTKEAKKKREKWVKSRGVTDKKCDTLWSQIVRSVGHCEYCGKTEYLHAHHIFGRTNKAVRWDIANGICLCAGCHKFSRVFSAHETPTEFTLWLYKKKGDAFMEDLRSKAMVITKPDLTSVYARLKEKE